MLYVPTRLPKTNAILEIIHLVLGNLVGTYNIRDIYVDEEGLWSIILASVASAIYSTSNGSKVYTLVQLVFGRDMIIPIKHKVYLGLIRQKN